MCIGEEEEEEEEKMGVEVDDHEEERSPLLESFSSSSPPSDHQSNESIKRRGTTWTAVAHIITGVIGAGVLSLAWSVAQLGWIAGPISMLVFAAITLISTHLLSDVYRYPDPEFGHTRSGSYSQAVLLYLGEKWQYVSGIIALENLYGCGVAYTITAASSIRDATFQARVVVLNFCFGAALILLYWCAMVTYK